MISLRVAGLGDLGVDVHRHHQDRPAGGPGPAGVGEESDDAGAACDLPIEPLQGVRALLSTLKSPGHDASGLGFWG